MGGLTVSHFVVLSAVIFCLGLFCVVTRRNALGILMGIELILNSANINYVAFGRYGGTGYDGQVFAIFVIMVVLDAFSVFFKLLLGLSLLAAIWMSLRSPEVRGRPNEGEYFTILLASGLGMTAMQAGGDDGMVQLERSLADLVRGGTVPLQAARAVAGDPKALDDYLGARRPVREV